MLKYKVKYLLALFISLIPINILRILCYNLILRYKISFHSYIGFFTIISVNSAVISSCNIGAFNTFKGPFDLIIESNSVIGDHNLFECGYWVLKEIIKNFNRKCVLKQNSLITSNHFFDTAGGFELGNNSWIAGRGSQFWTHGGKPKNDRSIVIGNNTYIGSAVRFTQGTSIGNDCIVALGSVVTKKFIENNLLIGGVPARKISSI